MKKPNLFLVILYGLCAAICTLRVILDVVCEESHGSLFVFVLNLLCAVIWTAAFIGLLIKHRSKT